MKRTALSIDAHKIEQRLQSIASLMLKFGMFICLTDGALWGLVPKVALGPNAKFAMGRWPIQYWVRVYRLACYGPELTHHCCTDTVQSASYSDSAIRSLCNKQKGRKKGGNSAWPCKEDNLWLPLVSIDSTYRYKGVLQCLQHKRGDGDRQHRG